MCLHKGQTNTGSFKLGEHRSLETEIKSGQRLSPRTEFKKDLPPWNKGRKWPQEIKDKFSRARKGRFFGSENPFWKGGVSTEHQKIRGSSDLKKWRKAVFERDHYTCQNCGARGVYLHADHIKPFSLFASLRFVVSNGRTLCRDCHKKTPTYGSKIHKTATLEACS
jgi:hypothetical protein